MVLGSRVQSDVRAGALGCLTGPRVAGSSFHLGCVAIVCFPIGWIPSLVAGTAPFLFPVPHRRALCFGKKGCGCATRWPPGRPCPSFSSQVAPAQQVLRPLRPPALFQVDWEAHTPPRSPGGPLLVWGPETQNKRNGLKTGASPW